MTYKNTASEAQVPNMFFAVLKKGQLSSIHPDQSAKPLTAARVMFQALLVFAPKLNENLPLPPWRGDQTGRGGLISMRKIPPSIRDQSHQSTRNSSRNLFHDWRKHGGWTAEKSECIVWLNYYWGTSESINMGWFCSTWVRYLMGSIIIIESHQVSDYY